MGITTVRFLVDSARSRHWAFSALQGGDGPALLYLTQRLATRVAMHGAAIEGLIGTSMQYTVPLPTGSLLVTDSGSILTTNFGVSIITNLGTGVPQVGAAYQDGWPIQLTPGGIPYVDFSAPPLAGDPFGLNGGIPGFPLPTEMVRLIAVSLAYNANPATFIPCDVVTESQRFSMMPSRNPAAFVSGNRLVPMLPLDANNQADRWFNVTKVMISYVAVQRLQTLDDVLNIPAVLVEGLIADLAEYFAMQSKAISAADKAMFSKKADATSATVGAAGLDMLEEGEQENVIYKG